MSERTPSHVEPSGTGQLRAVIAMFYVGLAAVIIAAVLAGFAAKKLVVAAVAKPPPTPNPLANPFVYHDPHRLFTIAIPSTWQYASKTSSIKVTTANGKLTLPRYTITIRPPSTDAAHKGDALIVSEDPLTSANARQWQCAANLQTNTTIAGVSATQITGQSVWLLNVATAHYQIAVEYPGAVIGSPATPGPQTPTPTPVPTKTLAANQPLMMMIFATFQPTSTQALSCM